MFLCAEVVDSVCLEWVDVSAIFAVEDGIGLQLGVMLFGVAVVAWCARTIAMFILNR